MPYLGEKCLRSEKEKNSLLYDIDFLRYRIMTIVKINAYLLSFKES